MLRRWRREFKAKLGDFYKKKEFSAEALENKRLQKELKEVQIECDILNREFETNTLGEKWVSDITYIRVNDEWNYLTTIIYLADRKMVGWSLMKI